VPAGHCGYAAETVAELVSVEVRKINETTVSQGIFDSSVDFLNFVHVE